MTLSTYLLKLMATRILTARRVENFDTQGPTPRVVRVQSEVSSTSVDVQSFVNVAVSVTLNAACFGLAACAAAPAATKRHANTASDPSRSIRFIVSAFPCGWEVSVRPLRSILLRARNGSVLAECT